MRREDSHSKPRHSPSQQSPHLCLPVLPAIRFNNFAQRVDDPRYSQQLQQSLYLLTQRPIGQSALDHSQQASAVEDAGNGKRGPHVP